MPPNGNVIEVFEEVNSEGVNQTCVQIHSVGNEGRPILQALPWLIRTAAYTPIVVLSFGTKPVLMEATVEIKVAHAKLWERLVGIPETSSTLRDG